MKGQFKAQDCAHSFGEQFDVRRWSYFFSIRGVVGLSRGVVPGEMRVLDMPFFARVGQTVPALKSSCWVENLPQVDM